MSTVLSLPPIRGELRDREPMARHVSWRAGGVAERFFEPADVEELALFLTRLGEDEPLHWLGLGSNLLVRDGGLRGTTIATRRLNRIVSLENRQVRVEAGVPSAILARFCRRESLAGAEFFAGIPGTLGGALAMNAGCFGAETWQLVKAVETVDRHGNLRLRTAKDFRISYRQVDGPKDEWYVAAHLQLQAGAGEALAERMREYLARRSATQPTQQPNAGSVFRNPPGQYAAQLIETCGLKGACIGGACVSEKHANFIINTGNATATEIETLILHVAEQVYRTHGVQLEREVHIIGDLVENESNG